MESLIQSLIKIGAPLLGGLVGGPMGAAVVGALADALGTPATPEATAQAIENNPNAAGVVLKLQADKGPEFLAELNARLADVQDARATTVKLVEQGSTIAWGAPVVSGLVLGTFAVVMVMVTWRGTPSGSDAVMIGLIELLKIMSVSVVGYWVGSSAGQARNGETIRNIATQASAPTAGQIAGKAIDAAVKTASKR